MKVLVLCLALCVVVMGEMCRDDGDCRLTTCSDNSYSVHCVHHECTCTQGHSSGATCQGTGDCPDCDRGNKHCIDGRCRCTRI